MADLGFLLDQWAAISLRLDEALALPTEQHAAWLAGLDEAPAIKDQLRQLLSRAPGVETDDFAQALPRLTLGPDEPFAKDPACAGVVIGPYRLIRELGVGGMGVVWLAERESGPLKQQVALKLPRASWSRDLAERMHRERDILASLDHPLIARIHDAGVDGQGRPYLALEYVEGEAIDVYCNAHALPVRDRLLLLLQVADAVSHAHERLVVHRDLKPANILINAQGQVRLLDFGIAKLMEGELTRETQLTLQAGHALTLDYASPEQIRGEPIGTASDVYSLGVVAYELLAEAKPYQLKRQSAAALEQAIAAVDVRLASTAAGKAETRRALAGDLDAILNKALKKDLTDRYPSVRAFAQDIERHLARQPVLARPDTFGYRLRKFVRRNALAVAAATAVGISLLGGLSLAIWQAREARAQAERAEHVKEFVLAIFNDADSDSEAGTSRTGADLLKLARQRVGAEAGASPEVAVELMTAIGQSMLGQGLMADAAALMLEAVDLSTRQFGALHALTCAATFVAGQAAVELGRGQQAITDMAPCIASSRRAGDLKALRTGLRWLSTAYFNQGRTDEGVAAAREVVATLSERPSRGKPPSARETMLAYQAYAEALGQADQPGAADAAQRALAAAHDVYGDKLVQSVLDIRTMLALAQVTEGQLEAGLRGLDTLVPATESLLGPRHARVSQIAHLVGDTRQSAGDVQGAILAFRRSMEVEDANAGSASTFGRGMARFFLGMAYTGAHQPEQALPLLAEAETMLSQSVGPDNPRTLRARSAHAWQLAEAGRLVEAENRFAALAAAPWSAAADLAGYRRRLSALRSLQGRHEEAVQLAESASEALLKVANKNVQARGLLQLGKARIEGGDARQALAPLQEARDLFSQSQIASSPDRAQVLLALGRAQLQLGDVDAAVASLAAAAGIWQSLDPHNRQHGLAQLYLAQGLLAQGNRAAAVEAFRRANPILDSSVQAADRAQLNAVQRRLAD